jgi:hypothetical protein
MAQDNGDFICLCNAWVSDGDIPCDDSNCLLWDSFKGPGAGEVLTDLTRAKAVFQLLAIAAVLGLPGEKQ